MAVQINLVTACLPCAGLAFAGLTRGKTITIRNGICCRGRIHPTVTPAKLRSGPLKTLPAGDGHAQLRRAARTAEPVVRALSRMMPVRLPAFVTTSFRTAHFPGRSLPRWKSGLEVSATRTIPFLPGWGLDARPKVGRASSATSAASASASCPNRQTAAGGYPTRVGVGTQNGDPASPGRVGAVALDVAPASARCGSPTTQPGQVAHAKRGPDSGL